MSISFDGNLAVMNLDVQDLVGLSDVQIEDKITLVLPEMSTSELKTFMTDLRSRLSDIKKELNDLQNGYEDKQAASETVEGRARYDVKIGEVQDALDALDQIGTDAEQALERETFLNVETDQDIGFSYGTNDLNQLNNGDVVNLTALAGAQNSIFGDVATDTAPTDKNTDGFITYDDTIATPDAAALTAGQDVHLQINSGDRINLVSANGDTATYQLITSDGKNVTININGSSNIFFDGSKYLDTASLGGWPEDLLKRCYDNTDTMSFFDRTHDDSLTSTERLSYVGGHADVVNLEHFNSIKATYGISDNTSFSTYSSIMDKLFSYIDDTSPNKSIDTVWNDIIASYTIDGDMALALTMGMAIYGGQEYFSLFTPAVRRLEIELGFNPPETENLNTNAKTAIMLLELNSGGAGQLGGAESFWSTAFATEDPDNVGSTIDGKWLNHDNTNVDAITAYQNALDSIDWANASGKEELAKEMEQGPTAADGTDPLSEIQANGESIYETAFDKLYSLISTYNDGITEGKMRDLLSELETNTIQDGQLNVDLISQGLVTTISGMGENGDDFMNNFVLMLKDMRESGNEDLIAFANLYLESKGTRNYMIEIIENASGSFKEIKDNEEDAWNYLQEF